MVQGWGSMPFGLLRRTFRRVYAGVTQRSSRPTKLFSQHLFTFWGWRAGLPRRSWIRAQTEQVYAKAYAPLESATHNGQQNRTHVKHGCNVTWGMRRHTRRVYARCTRGLRGRGEIKFTLSAGKMRTKEKCIRKGYTRLFLVVLFKYTKQ